MILQALAQYYCERCKIDSNMPRRGWSKENVAYAINLDENGHVLQLISLRNPVMRGKKEVQAPQEMLVPQRFGRKYSNKTYTSRSAVGYPYFLCDNGKYLLGLDDGLATDDTKKDFISSKELHTRILSEADTPAAKAVSAFFLNWQCDSTADCFSVNPDVLKEAGKVNFVFRVNGQYAHECPEIQKQWERYYNQSDNCELIRCLITGNQSICCRLHPQFKVKGAQSSALVSFDDDAYCSYGNKQGRNAPTSNEAAYAYGEALKYLLKNPSSRCDFDDTVVLCWAGNADNNYSELFISAAGMRIPDKSIKAEKESDTDDDAGFSISLEDDSPYSERDLQNAVKELSQGRLVTFCDSNLDPDQPFYVLGISPNKARLAVRFFMCNSFGKFINNIEAHHRRLQIYHSSVAKNPARINYPLSVHSLIWETVNKKSRDKKAAQILIGETLRAVINNEPYPASLLSGVELRIRAESAKNAENAKIAENAKSAKNEKKAGKCINRARAAIIKAFYLRNNHPDVSEEVLTVSLNENSTDCAYLLGRLFATLEHLQEVANERTTINRFFNSASSTPAVVFPQLIALAQSHLKKLDGGQKVYFEKMLAAIMDKLEAPLPSRFNLAQRGVFQLAYYHQSQYFYTPKSARTVQEN